MGVEGAEVQSMPMEFFRYVYALNLNAPRRRLCTEFGADGGVDVSHLGARDKAASATRLAAVRTAVLRMEYCMNGCGVMEQG